MKGQISPEGATRTSPNGYHYTKTNSRWELTHKLTAEKKLGRPLHADERVRFRDGDRKNFADPDNIIVYTIKSGSRRRRIAHLEAKIAELQAELADLKQEELSERERV